MPAIFFGCCDDGWRHRWCENILEIRLSAAHCDVRLFFPGGQFVFKGEFCNLEFVKKTNLRLWLLEL
ncbi:unnamed protein product [Calypogeia fissa]